MAPDDRQYAKGVVGFSILFRSSEATLILFDDVPLSSNKSPYSYHPACFTNGGGRHIADVK